MGYNDAEKALCSLVKSQSYYNSNTLYLLYLETPTTHSEIKGHMPFNELFGFIYGKNQSVTEVPRSMAHELGHGAFRLYHTFDTENTYVQDKFSTQNLMDYTNGTELLKYQWDECHKWHLGINWFADGDEAASKSKSNITITTTTSTNLLDGSRLGTVGENKKGLTGKLLVMNDPSTQFTLSLGIDSKYIQKRAVKVEWTFEDPDDANATPDEAYSDGTIKLGKKGDATATFWEGVKGYTFATTLNTTANTSIVDTKTSINFAPSGVGGDNYYIVAKIMDKDGKVLNEEKSDLLTVVRKVKFDQLYHMQGATDLLPYASEANIQSFFTPAFIVYEAPTSNIELNAKLSPHFIGLYDPNEPNYQKTWHSTNPNTPGIADPIVKLPVIMTVDGIDISSEVLTSSEQSNCSDPMVTSKARAWKSRLYVSREACINQWMADAGIQPKSIVSLQYVYPKLGFDRNSADDQAIYDYNPFAPCNPIVPQGKSGGTVTISGNYWTNEPLNPVGGWAIGDEISIITLNSTGTSTLTIDICHEIAHSTINVVNGVKVMYRVGFGSASDHSDDNNKDNLMAPKPVSTLTTFGDKEILILRGYKKQ
jgi:hypothetical protein